MINELVDDDELGDCRYSVGIGSHVNILQDPFKRC